MVDDVEGDVSSDPSQAHSWRADTWCLSTVYVRNASSVRGVAVICVPAWKGSHHTQLDALSIQHVHLNARATFGVAMHTATISTSIAFAEGTHTH